MGRETRQGDQMVERDIKARNQMGERDQTRQGRDRSNQEIRWAERDKTGRSDVE